MKCIAITGIMGAGKTTVTKLFHDRGFATLSADTIVHDLMLPKREAYHRIVEEYGPQCLDEQGLINRKYLAERLFQDRELKKRHEAWIHPMVMKEIAKMRQIMQKDQHEILFVEIPLLYEANLEKEFDDVIVVTAPYQNIYKHLRDNRQIDETEAKQRIAQQMDQNEKALRADFVIVNDQNLLYLKQQCDQIIQQLKGR